MAQSDLQPVPVADGFLADPAGILSVAERTRISALLKKLSQEKGSQLGVVIVRQTDPESIEEFAQRVFITWKLGRRGVDDGVLLVLAVDNKSRRLRIHTGYGLEGALPDAIARRILAEQIRPALEKSGPAAAIGAGVDAILARINSANIAAKPDSKNANTPPAATVIEVGDGVFKLIMGMIALLPLCAIAGYLFSRRFRIHTKFVIGLFFGVLTAAVYIWVAWETWAIAAAAIWLTIPALVAWKNWARISETAWSRPPEGMAKAGARELSRKALRSLQAAALIAAVIVAAPLGVFSSVTGLFAGLFWLIFAALIATQLTRIQPSTGRSRGQFWTASGDTSSSDGGSTDSGSGSGDSSSGDSGGGDSGGGGSSE